MHPGRFKLLVLLLVMSFPFVLGLQVWPIECRSQVRSWIEMSSVDKHFVNNHMILLCHLLIHKTWVIKWHIWLLSIINLAKKKEEKRKTCLKVHLLEVSGAFSHTFPSLSSVNRCSSVVMEISWSFVLPNNWTNPIRWAKQQHVTESSWAWARKWNLHQDPYLSNYFHS